MKSLSKELNTKLEQERSEHAHHGRSAMPLMMLGALGVVYGDIGTSPLYAIHESFVQTGLPVVRDNVLGFLSMAFWLLTIVVSIKYVSFIMRAHNKGEGGNLALLALVLRLTRSTPKFCAFIGLVGIMAGSLFYADAVITPAISVLSAMEGIEVVAPSFHHFILPATLVIIIFLFIIQQYGTSKVGSLFGPVMVVWFLTLGVLGLSAIFRAPEVLLAVNPYHAAKFFFDNHTLSLVALGAIVLSVTGAEALYADMGHFGAKPIRYAWFALVFPCLVLNYFGQGALLLTDPEAIDNPFFLLAPKALSLPLLVLSVFATIIASQAMITGAYSVTRQAIQLGYLPRMRVLYTSAREMGQIYVPFVNWALLACVLVTTLIFQTSSGLAAAYGVAVTGVFVIVSLMVGIVMRLKWHWSWPAILATAGVFSLVDGLLFSASLSKIAHGAYIPLIMAGVLFTVFTTWKSGQRILNEKIARASVATERFIREIHKNPPVRVPGTAVYMTARHGIVPPPLMHNLKHNKVLHERVIFLTVMSQDVPYVAPESRVHVYNLGYDFYQLDLHTGFKDEPDVPAALRQCLARGMDFDHIHQASFFLGRETVISTPEESGIVRWRERLFSWMKKNASSAADYYGIPADRVIEIGGRYEI